MNSLTDLLHYSFLGNVLENYLWFILIILLGIIGKRILSKISSRLLYRLFKRYANEMSSDRFFGMLKKPFNTLIMLIFFYIAINQLQYPPQWNLGPKQDFGVKMVGEKLYQIIFFSVIIWIVLKIVDISGEILKKRSENHHSKSNEQIVSFIMDTLKVMVVVLGIFIILGTVLNLNIGSVVAGLGIGGLAIALAAKETLENLLGSFTIFLDKPFEQGDLVKIHEVTGVIEKVGFRSTRIRTLDKTFVTIPNKKMVDAELDNLSLRTMQRAKFTVAFKHQTPVVNLRQFTAEMEKYLQHHYLIQDDFLIKLIEINPFGLELQIMFFVDSTDYTVFARIREEVNYKIMELAGQLNLEFSIIDGLASKYAIKIP